MSADETRQLPVQQPRPAPETGAASAAPTPPATSSVNTDATANDELRALARKSAGLVVGLALLIGCGFAVSHLNAWGERLELDPVSRTVWVGGVQATCVVA
ncbi:hypothetical protein, partial [Tsukamurella spumae]|uniref:hypothetical protein n=1 Tax=Tsukamurella spumae TaxID=44753 RepID=UPI0031D344F0